ncbi:MAG: hypothetical protein RLZZ196_1023 [Bacteroidota bacterium]|jgi:WD40 repeat protein
MNSQTIQNQIYQWASNRHDFTAPYGVLSGSHVSPNGKRYLSVTFGKARTLDATVEIYNRNFIILKTSNHGRQVFKNVNELQQALDAL